MQKVLKSVNIWQSYKQEGGLLHFMRLATADWFATSRPHRFSDIPQGSVATHVRYGGIVNKFFAANLLENLAVKKILKIS